MFVSSNHKHTHTHTDICNEHNCQAISVGTRSPYTKRNNHMRNKQIDKPSSNPNSQMVESMNDQFKKTQPVKRKRKFKSEGIISLER